MSVQFGVLARLTWWEYSWDIMEPVTYFVTYGTAMAVYAYFCITKQVSFLILSYYVALNISFYQEYNFLDVSDRQYLLSIHKRAKKKSFDINEYNIMKRQIAEIEFDLKRLKDPLYLQIPPHFQKSLPPSKQSSSKYKKDVDVKDDKSVLC